RRPASPVRPSSPTTSPPASGWRGCWPGCAPATPTARISTPGPPTRTFPGRNTWRGSWSGSTTVSAARSAGWPATAGPRTTTGRSAPACSTSSGLAFVALGEEPLELGGEFLAGGHRHVLGHEVLALGSGGERVVLLFEALD